MIIKTLALIGTPLDWTVANIEKVDFYRTTDPDRYNPEIGLTHNFNPSVDWSQGGPIIEREKIILLPGNMDWAAGTRYDYDWLLEDAHSGQTPLIAAMRVYVNSRLGAEVNVPDEFCN